MKVIGLTGPAQVGKDTVAAIIAEEVTSYTVKREGFADRLKVSAARALGLDGSTKTLVAAMDKLKIDGEIEVELGAFGELVTISGRAYLQRFGTEAHREVFGDDFWVDAVLPISGHYPPRDDVDLLVIPDVRFENEARRVHAYGGEVWRIQRNGVDRVNGHASEAGVPDELVTRTIKNDGGLGYLRGAVRWALIAAYGGRSL